MTQLTNQKNSLKSCRIHRIAISINSQIRVCYILRSFRSIDITTCSVTLIYPETSYLCISIFHQNLWVAQHHCPAISNIGDLQGPTGSFQSFSVKWPEMTRNPATFPIDGLRIFQLSRTLIVDGKFLGGSPSNPRFHLAPLQDQAIPRFTPVVAGQAPAAMPGMSMKISGSPPTLGGRQDEYC